MTRKEFFKKLGIGVAAIVVAPKVIAEPKDKFDGKNLNGLLWDEQGHMADYSVSQRYLHNKSIIDQMTPYMDNIQSDWLKMEIAMEKERKRIINDLITFGEAKTNML